MILSVGIFADIKYRKIYIFLNIYVSLISAFLAMSDIEGYGTFIHEAEDGGVVLQAGGAAATPPPTASQPTAPLPAAPPLAAPSLAAQSTAAPSVAAPSPP